MKNETTEALQLRNATKREIPQIWEILKGAINRRKVEGSKQWQDGYPNLQVVEQDIENKHGFVLCDGNQIIGYAAILINDEPEYAKIVGKWLSNQDFIVVHRIAIAENCIGKGFAKKMMQKIEEFALKSKIFSIKVDTNFDNAAMLAIFEKCDYTYCGEVFFRGSARKAFEKVVGL